MLSLRCSQGVLASGEKGREAPRVLLYGRAPVWGPVDARWVNNRTRFRVQTSELALDGIGLGDDNVRGVDEAEEAKVLQRLHNLIGPNRGCLRQLNN
jgi:hypothetical protein